MDNCPFTVRICLFIRARLSCFVNKLMELIYFEVVPAEAPVKTHLKILTTHTAQYSST